MSAPDRPFPEIQHWEYMLVNEPDRLEFVFRFVDADGNPLDESGRLPGVPADVAPHDHIRCSAGSDDRERVASDESGGGVAWFRDSEGNVLTLTQIPPGMALPGDVT